MNQGNDSLEILHRLIIRSLLCLKFSGNRAIPSEVFNDMNPYTKKKLMACAKVMAEEFKNEPEKSAFLLGLAEGDVFDAP
ncbi:MAG TPA: hypothetical protein DCZ95_16905 [Verrucomicrobia bacterium]|nr:MAG: hypothetical protein A2X46_09395 [Lentisphaerae bacterium GWF2_57_35]HBA85764.1 hypothetical protein [Verrucomicrobiota bacterium]